MEGIERLEAEALEMKNYNIMAIFDYLKTRTELYEKFNNTEKSIKQMYKFIYNKAKEHKQGDVAMVSDRMVYLWAMTYFNKSNEELGIKEEKVTTSKTNIIKEENLKKESCKIENKKDNQITLFEEARK